MIDSVANKMHQRLAQSIQNTFIEIGVLPRDVERHVLAAQFGNVTHHARKSPEELLHRHHANFQNAFVQLVQDARLKAQRFCEFGANRITRMALVKLGQRAMQHGLAND